MGSLPGVVSTRAAWVGEREVVDVEFRPGALPFAKLLDAAIANSCDQHVYATTDDQLAAAREKVGERAERLAGDPRVAKESDQLYYLGLSHLRYVPLTPAQARQVNAALGLKADPLPYLSPRQRELAIRVAATLEEDAAALDGLARPSDLAGLDEYAGELASRLEEPDPGDDDEAGLHASLRALAPLVGGEWKTAFPNGMTDVQRFEPMVAGRFLRNVHEVRDTQGKVVYEGETVYGAGSEEDGSLRWWYFNSTGGWIDGTIVPGAGGTFDYEGENHAPSGQTDRVRGRFELDELAAGRFKSLTWFWRDGDWHLERELVYERSL